MKYISLLSVVLFLLACTSIQDVNNPNPSGDKDVVLLIQSNRLHCGGAAPPRDGWPAGEMELHAEETFYLKKGLTNDHVWTNAIKVTTDMNGLDTLKLAVGDYMVFREDKILDFAGFRSKNKTADENYKETSQECFKYWHNAADYVISVKSDTTITINLKHKCFTGYNPCIEYTGPLPN
jgi:hypothetical protein